MLIADAAIDRRSTVFALMLIILIVGIYSYIVLPRESTPDITVPYVLVVTPYEGVTPDDIESLITYPIERKLKGLKDVEKIDHLLLLRSRFLQFVVHWGGQELL